MGAVALVPSVALAAASPSASAPLTWSSAVNAERPPYQTPTSIAAL
jgi:hypothetical protein